ncbi:MAG: hypothetical protein PHI79_05770 [Sulfurovaceae bacterium]|nr:hypothetical protein [Sulfurovaceae bacterium]MDD5549085.1 hypothetical protein [Sulfurovaceae bacterium]
MYKNIEAFLSSWAFKLFHKDYIENKIKYLGSDTLRHIKRSNIRIYYILKNVIVRASKKFKQIRFNIIMIRNDESVTKNDCLVFEPAGLKRV